MSVFHIPSLGHLPCNKTSVSCAFSQKCFKLARMLTERGHTVYHYGVEGSDPVCTENVIVASDEERRAAYPDNDDRTKQFKFQCAPEYDRTFDARVATAVMERVQGPGEFLLCAWGLGHKPIADFLGDRVITVESGIGYEFSFARFKVFESSAWMHYCWGREGRGDGDWYSEVIPNFFDPADFEYREQKDDYLLYLGRIVKRKGVELAAQIATATNHRLIIAGQGQITDEGMNVDMSNVEFVGYADVEKRRELLAGAKALLAPTYFVEPFGGVAVEAQMSGCPVIASPWGGFTETVLQGKTGYLCHTFADFCEAVNKLYWIEPGRCREWAMTRYSCDVIAPRYEAFFERVLKHGAVLPGADWYSRP